MHPQILYWKWNDSLFDEKVLEEKAMDIIKRSNFRDIAIAPHSMTKPEGSFLDPVMQRLVRRVNDNMTENSCTFEDGSVIFTTDGEQNLFNPLSVEFELEGHKIVFKGKDFLAFRLNGDKPEFVFGECDMLTLDGESLV